MCHVFPPRQSHISTNMAPATAASKRAKKADTRVIVTTCYETMDVNLLTEIAPLKSLSPEVALTVSSLIARFTQGSGMMPTVRTNYKRAHNSKGRIYADSASLQNVKSVVARLVGHQLYTELDIHNCAPTCLLHLANKHDVDCFHLKQYVTNRSECFERLRVEEPQTRQMSDADLKKIILAVVHGGNYDKYLVGGPAPLRFVDSLQQEIKALYGALRISGDFDDVWTIVNEGSGDNKKGTFLALVWQSIEVDILLSMKKCIEARGVSVSVLKHDGLYVRHDGPVDIDIDFVRSIQDAVCEETGVDIKLKMKDLTPTAEDDRIRDGPKYLHCLSDFEKIIHIVCQYAKSKGFQRVGEDSVLVPHEVLPCVLTYHCDHLKFIQEAVNFAKIMFNPKDFTNPLKWMGTVSHHLFPIIHKENFHIHRVVFNNGYFDLSELALHMWSDPMTDRSFVTDMFMEFDCPLVGDPLIFDTPGWTSLLAHQLTTENDVDWLEALIGRLNFPVGDKDNWQIMPWIVGDANTGKSTVCNIVSRMFPPDSVGSITATFEPRFGLEPLRSKRVLITADAPTNIHQLLAASDFQSMVTGDAVSVARKMKRAICGSKWTVPMLNASNEPGKWRDVNGSIQRRCWHFQFKSFITSRNTSLQDKIISDELPYIWLRCVIKYAQKREQVAAEDIWKFAPPNVRMAKEDLTVFTDPLSEFIANGSKYYQVMREPGAYTSIHDLSAAFSKFMEFERKVKNVIIGKNYYPIRAAGFVIERTHVCKICNLKRTKQNCKGHFESSQRTTVAMIKDMVIKDTRFQWDPNPVRIQ